MLQTIKKSAVLLGVLALAPLGNAYAEMKIGVVNVQVLLEESPPAKAAKQSLQDEFAPRQRELQQKQKDLQAQQDRLNRDQAIMSEAERTAAEKNFRKAERELKDQAETFSEEFNTRRNEALGKIQAEMLQEVQLFAKANNYDLIAPAANQVFAKDNLDLTTQVMAAWQVHSNAAAEKAQKSANKNTKPAATKK